MKGRQVVEAPERKRHEHRGEGGYMTQHHPPKSVPIIADTHVGCIYHTSNIVVVCDVSRWDGVSDE